MRERASATQMWCIARIDCLWYGTFPVSVLVPVELSQSVKEVSRMDV